MAETLDPVDQLCPKKCGYHKDTCQCVPHAYWQTQEKPWPKQIVPPKRTYEEMLEERKRAQSS